MDDLFQVKVVEELPPRRVIPMTAEEFEQLKQQKAKRALNDTDASRSDLRTDMKCGQCHRMFNSKIEPYVPWWCVKCWDKAAPEYWKRWMHQRFSQLLKLPMRRRDAETQRILKAVRIGIELAGGGKVAWLKDAIECAYWLGMDRGYHRKWCELMLVELKALIAELRAIGPPQEEPEQLKINLFGLGGKKKK